MPRIISGPIAGFAAYSIGWAWFFWSTLPLGIPGLIMLARFVPWNAREVEFRVEPPRIREPLTGGQLATRGLAGGAVGFAVAALILALLEALNTNSGDAIIASLAITPEIRRRIDFSDPYYRTPARFVSRKDVEIDGLETAARRLLQAKGK